jgi:hypothetical protein
MADVTTREGRAELRRQWTPQHNRPVKPGLEADMLYLLAAADERDRLREALQQIVRAPICDADEDDLKRIARSALSPSGDTPAGEGVGNG